MEIPKEITSSDLKADANKVKDKHDEEGRKINEAVEDKKEIEENPPKHEGKAKGYDYWLNKNHGGNNEKYKPHTSQEEWVANMPEHIKDNKWSTMKMMRAHEAKETGEPEKKVEDIKKVGEVVSKDLEEKEKETKKEV